MNTRTGAPAWPNALLPAQRSTRGTSIGRASCVLFAPLVMLIGGGIAAQQAASVGTVLDVSSAADLVGFCLGAIASAVGLGVLLGSTHAVSERRSAAVAYSAAALLWGTALGAFGWWVLSSITLGSSC